jgi:hypothetical protein
MRLLTTPGGQPCRVYHTVPKRAYDVPGARAGRGHEDGPRHTAKSSRPG